MRPLVTTFFAPALCLWYSNAGSLQVHAAPPAFQGLPSCSSMNTCFDSCAGGDRNPPNYGPGVGISRGTLFQWSYETSFSGGLNLDEPLATDRPDFTEASSTVGLGVLQIEAGYTFTSNKEGGTATTSHSYPETLFRYGILADWLEFRVGQNFVGEDDGFLNNSGAEDLYLGFKIALTPQEGWLPEMAIVPQMTVPTGYSAFTADEILAGVNWIYAWNLNNFISTAGSTQFNRAVDDGTGNTYTEWAQSWTIGYSLTEKLGAYAEWFAFFLHGADTAKVEHYADGGFTYLINNNIQWDIRAGVGLNSAAEDHFVGTGLAIRLK